MLIFTETGYVSILGSKQELIVESNTMSALETLARMEDKKIIFSPQREYQNYFNVNRGTVADWIGMLAKNISYDDFNAEVAERQSPEFAKVVAEVETLIHGGKRIHLDKW